MEKDRSDLMVFIDLGFLLLVGFLILTETTPRVNVVLPSNEETATPEQEVDVFNLHFGEALQFRIDNGQEILCAPQSLEELVSCMMGQDQTAVFVLIPTSVAPVQNLVSLLDLCQRYNRTCTIPN